MPVKKIAIFRALLLGDLLCTVPALRALRKSLPHASITLIGLPWARDFVDVYGHYLDDFIEFPGFPGLTERAFDAKTFPSFLHQVHAKKFDLVLQMHGSGGISNPLVSLFGARFTAGFYQPGQYRPDPERFLPYQSGTHEVWRHLELLQFLGLETDGEDLDFPISESDARELEQVASLSEPFVCLHPGAKAEFRCWPVEKFAALGDHLVQGGFQVVLTGTRGEHERVERVRSLMRNPALNLAGKTSFRSLAALIHRSEVLICNDTGVSHLAVALGHPSVVVFTRSELLGWPPLNRNLHRVVSRLQGVGVQDVIMEVMDLLANVRKKSLLLNGMRKESSGHGAFENSHLAYPW